MEKYFSDDFIQKTVEKISTEAVSCIMEQIKSAINEKQQRSVRTIEERAEYYERRCAYAKSLGWDVPRPSENYEHGAYDQRKIDIDKACVWLEKELQGIATDELKENFLENEFKLILKSQVPNWLINFRKAMEE